MIDNEIIHNFIFQFQIKEHNFVEIDIQFQTFRCLDNIALKIDKFHNLNVDVINQQNIENTCATKTFENRYNRCRYNFKNVVSIEH